MKKNDGSLSLATRSLLARDAFGQTSRYDIIVCAYLAKTFPVKENEPGTLGGIIMGTGGGSNWTNTFRIGSEGIGSTVAPTKIDSEEFSIEIFRGSLPDSAQWTISKTANLRYGENPHQIAALYKTTSRSGIANAELLSGKEMSFNNYVDADAAWQLVFDFESTACAIIKHTNPAGVGLGAHAEQAYRKALATDPVSAFGGIVAFNCPVDEAAARAVIEIFTEVLIAPEYDERALELPRSKKNLRVLRARPDTRAAGLEYKQISGGLLVQTRDTHRLSNNHGCQQTTAERSRD